MGGWSVRWGVLVNNLNAPEELLVWEGDGCRALESCIMDGTRAKNVWPTIKEL